MTRLAIRARLLDFTADPTHSAGALRLLDDGLLVIDDGRVAARGAYRELAPSLEPDLVVADHSGCLLLPGFIDAHTHYAQLDAIAAPASGLLEWLKLHTYPAEARAADAEYCRQTAAFFFDELARQGTTAACVLGTVHPHSVDALFSEALARNVRLVAGKCLMDRHCPEILRDTADRGLHESLELAARWHGRGRLAYAITPRFAASSTPRQLQLAGELALARPDLYVQSHLAETEEEVRWVRELYPQARSYLDVYDGFGLLREGAVYAHCIWIDAADRRRLAQSRATAAACPGANLFLGSGAFDFRQAVQSGMTLALGTDIGAGPTLSMLGTMRAAYEVARGSGATLRAAQLYYWATRGAAEALGWGGKVGTLDQGAEADFVVLDPQATDLLARRCAAAQSVEALLFALMMLGDDRAVRETYIAGRASKHPAARMFRPVEPLTSGERTRELTRRFMGRLHNAPTAGGAKR